MQAENLNSVAILGLAVTIIGVLVTVASALGGFAYHVLDKRISEVKKDAKDAVADEERRRKEAITTVTNTINEHYDNLRRDLGEVKQDVKNLRRED